MDSNQQGFDQSKYLDNAIRAVKEKKPLPEIDFTLHTMEDGTQVSTLERVCKGQYPKHFSHTYRAIVIFMSAIMSRKP